MRPYEKVTQSLFAFLWLFAALRLWLVLNIDYVVQHLAFNNFVRCYFPLCSHPTLVCSDLIPLLLPPAMLCHSFSM